MIDLTPRNYAYLLLLKKVGREITNKEMDDLFGIRLVGSDLQQLLGAGWVDSKTPKGRAYSHRISTSGEKVLAGAVKIKKTLNDPLATVLPMLHDFLFEAPAEGRNDQPISDRIRSAYTKLVMNDEWVRLADLREALADVSPADLDHALKALHKEPDVRLEPEVNRQDLTPADRNAALRIGGEDRHKLAIGMP